MDLIGSSTEFLDRLKSNTDLFRNNMKAAGFTISGDNHPICPVMIGDARLATEFADKMIGKYLAICFVTYKMCFIISNNCVSLTEKGIYVIGFSYPVVPKDKARIRVQISAAHSQTDIEHAVNAFVHIGKELGIIN